MPGFEASSFPPKLSCSEKLPTMAKSLVMAFWVSCLLVAPLSASSPVSTTILRPWTPPVEFT